MIFWKNCSQKFVLMLRLCVGFDLLHVWSPLTFFAVERNVVAYCHAYF